MMLEAGSNPRVKNKGGLTAYHLVDPTNQELRDVIRQHEFASQNAGDYANVVEEPKSKSKKGKAASAPVEADPESDDDAEFSGSDEEERAEWERRRRAKGKA